MTARNEPHVRRILAMRAAQGLPARVEDPTALSVVASAVRQARVSGGDHRHGRDAVA